MGRLLSMLSASASMFKRTGDSEIEDPRRSYASFLRWHGGCGGLFGRDFVGLVGGVWKMHGVDFAASFWYERILVYALVQLAKVMHD